MGGFFVLLDCSKNGHFHPSKVRVEIEGYEDTIENHAVFTKRILRDNQIVAPTTLDEAIENPAVGFVVKGMLLPIKYYPQYVGLLWHKYLSANPKIVEELQRSNKFKEGEIYDGVSHLEIICKFLGYDRPNKKGNRRRQGMPGELLLEWCKPLTKLLNKDEIVIIEESRTLTDSINEVVGFFHYVEDVIEDKSQQTYKEFCPRVLHHFKKALRYDPSVLMGNCFVRKNEENSPRRLWFMKKEEPEKKRNAKQDVAFLGISEDEQLTTFKSSVTALKVYAQERNLAVSLPYNLGCEKCSGVEWEVRLGIIKEVFKDYYLTLHKEIHTLMVAEESAQG